MATEDFCLKWNDHQQVFFNSAERLCRTDVMTDVTLMCGSKEFSAHKLVLSACSGYFSGLFFNKRGRGSSPLTSVPVHSVIYIKDIDPNYLEAILDYMYRGEIAVQENELMGLLAAAKSLQVKGLTDASSTDEVPKAKPKKAIKRSAEDETEVEAAEEDLEQPEPKRVKEEEEIIQQQEHIVTNIVAVSTNEIVGDEPMPPRTTELSAEQLEQQHQTESIVEDYTGGGPEEEADIGDDEGVIEEYGGEEMEGETSGGAYDNEFGSTDELGASLISLSGSECPECMKSFSSKNCMKRHYNNVHVKDKPFNCWVCDYKASRRTSLRDHCLRLHKMSKEEFSSMVQDTFKKITVVKDDGTEGD